MALNVGVNVVEVDGPASPALQAAPTSVAAWLGLAERGVPSQPVRITNPAQFRERFGQHRSDSYMAYMVDGFFFNGGHEAYVSRIVGSGSTAAAVILNNRQGTPAPSWRAAAGYRGQEDPGIWGNRLRLEIRDDPRGSTQLQSDTVANASSAQLQSLHGIRVGSVVRFVNGTTRFYRKITDVSPATRTVSWASNQSISPILPQASTQVSSAEFRLLVWYQATASAEAAVVEDWRHMSLEADTVDYVSDHINHPFTGSRYIIVTDLSDSAPTGAENPAVTSNGALTNGTENAPTAADYTGDAAAKTGLYAFDTVQVQLLAATDAHTLPSAGRDNVVQGALGYCAARGDCMFVGAAPDRGAPAGVTPRSVNDYTQLESDYLNSITAYAANFQASKVYGALYAGWIRVTDPVAGGPAPARFVPPDGAVMGVYARTEQARGIWKAPAGSRAQLRGAQDVAATFSDIEHTDLVHNGLVNGIRRVAGSGITVAASRTLSTDTRWRFVNVRLLFNFVKSSLRDGLRFVRQEPHTEALRRTVRFNVVTPFLQGLWRQGAFGSDPPEQVFTVKCDANNNPPEEVNLGHFILEVSFYPVKPAETIQIIVGQQASGASANEV